MNKEAYRLLKLIGLDRRFIIMVLLRSPFDTLSAILTANIMQSFVELIENGEDSLWQTVLLFLGLSVLLFAYNMTIWSVIAVKISVSMQKNLRRSVFERIVSLPAERLEGAFGSDWFTRLNSDVDRACNYLNGAVNYIHMVVAAVNVIISSVIMLFINVELYIIGIICLLPFFFLNVLVISRKIVVHKRNAQYNLTEYTNWIDAVCKNRDMLAVFDGEGFIRTKIEEKSRAIMQNNMKAHNRASLSTMMYTFSGMLGYLMTLIRGNDIIGEEMIDFAVLYKMTQYRANMVMSVNLVYNCINNMKGNYVGIERIKEVIDAR